VVEALRLFLVNWQSLTCYKHDLNSAEGRLVIIADIFNTPLSCQWTKRI